MKALYAFIFRQCIFLAHPILIIKCIAGFNAGKVLISYFNGVFYKPQILDRQKVTEQKEFL